MKIGVLVTVASNSGGIYQYTYSILRALQNWRVGHEFAILKLDNNHLVLDEFDGPCWSVVNIDYQTASYKNVASHLCGDGLDVDKSGINPEAERFIKSQGIDLLLMPAPTSAAFEWGVPYIMAIHDLQHRLQPEFPEVSAGHIWKSREYLFRNACRFAEAILVDSVVGKEDVLNFYGDLIPAERIHALPFLPYYQPDFDLCANGRSRVREKYRLPEDYIFYPAQFWLHKNHSRLIHALQVLRLVHGVDIPLVLVGSNSAEPKEEAREHIFTSAMDLAKQLGVSDLVHYLGYVPDEDMPFLYAKARALTMPTFFGPTNIPILEAWAFGCPVLTSDIRGIREQVETAGLLVDPEDPYALAMQIRRLLSDENLRNELIVNGYKKCHSYTSIEFETRLYYIIDKVISFIENYHKGR